ncbi:MAG: hypothetical protein S4CHLAM102_14480 [Chlamydiia bacterium]|nr:hypothetical protein [Chlamydiia bacterium]
MAKKKKSASSEKEKVKKLVDKLCKKIQSLSVNDRLKLIKSFDEFLKAASEVVEQPEDVSSTEVSSLSGKSKPKKAKKQATVACVDRVQLLTEFLRGYRQQLGKTQYTLFLQLQQLLGDELNPALELSLCYKQHLDNEQKHKIMEAFFKGMPEKSAARKKK